MRCDRASRASGILCSGIDDPVLRQMLQALLIDRFQLKVHRESGSGDVYLLKRNDKPLALKPAKIEEGATESKPLASDMRAESGACSRRRCRNWCGLRA